MHFRKKIAKYILFGIVLQSFWHLQIENRVIFEAVAHLLRPPQDVKPNFSSLIASKVRATQGTTVVSLESVWDHPKNFYSQKTEILWAKYATFT